MKKEQEKQIGLWLDHAKAHFIDVSAETPVIQTAYSSLNPHEREDGEHGSGIRLGNNRSTNNEYQMHNREQEAYREFYKVLLNRLKNYDSIFMFGSAEAKDELHNLMKTDHHFDTKQIHIEPSDHLTENQMIARVLKYFKN